MHAFHESRKPTSGAGLGFKRKTVGEKSNVPMGGSGPVGADCVADAAPRKTVDCV